jgi:hypothetical protein
MSTWSALPARSALPAWSARWGKPENGVFWTLGWRLAIPTWARSHVLDWTVGLDEMWDEIQINDDSEGSAVLITRGATVMRGGESIPRYGAGHLWNITLESNIRKRGRKCRTQARGVQLSLYMVSWTARAQ